MRPGYELLQRYYRWFESADYTEEVAAAESGMYTPAALEKNDFLRLRLDLPPFSFAGRIHDGMPKIFTGGLNPKVSAGALPPANFADYATHAYERFARGSTSRFHDVFLHLIGGIKNHNCVGNQKWIHEHYATFDLFPHHSTSFSASTLTARRMKVVQPHFDNLSTLLGESEVELLILNGAAYRKHLVDRNGPMLVPPGSFVQAGDEILYGSVIERKDKKKPEGHALVGTLTLRGGSYPTVILSRFIHQARPPHDQDELRRLGARIRRRLSAARRARVASELSNRKHEGPN